MIFHEIYGCYYRAVSKIISAALDSKADINTVATIAKREAYAESNLFICRQSLFEWHLLDNMGNTPIKQKPFMPLSTIERRWLKAIANDPRIKLFGEIAGLEDVEPLFGKDVFSCPDRYGKGDDYEDLHYQEVFSLILESLKQRKALHIVYRGRKYDKGRERKLKLEAVPLRLEYSEKEDKFRLYARSKHRTYMLNLNRIVSAQKANEIQDDLGILEGEQVPQIQKEQVGFLLSNVRNSLERALIHFSTFEKTTEKLDDGRYYVRLNYPTADRSEIIIRLLSFGSCIEVTEPSSAVEEIRARLKKQAELLKR